jgi:NAD(P)-dependent dehydrogenase (short-subunit alcohol dehydrogenase family)
MSRFEGKTAIVAGGSNGIGRAIADRLAAEGARLVVVAAPRDEGDLDRAVEELRAAGAAVEGLAADVADPTTGDRAVELALSAHGGVDVLFNNAGHAFWEDVLDAPLEHFDIVLDVVLRGTFTFTVAAGRVMRERGGGAIVNTASTAAFVGEELQATYNAAKAAVVGLTRSLAVDLAPYGIRVNAVAPGWVDTRGTTAIITDAAEWAKHRSRIPLDRPATPQEIAAAHLFLASDDAAYITGAVLLVDGGLTTGFRASNWQAVVPGD